MSDGCMCTLRARWRVALTVTTLFAAACAGGSGISVPGAAAVPDISTYPPLANDAPPGASASATATAHAMAS